MLAAAILAIAGCPTFHGTATGYFPEAEPVVAYAQGTYSPLPTDDGTTFSFALQGYDDTRQEFALPDAAILSISYTYAPSCRLDIEYNADLIFTYTG